MVGTKNSPKIAKLDKETVLFSITMFFCYSEAWESEEEPFPGIEDQGSFPYSKPCGVDRSTGTCLWEKAKCSPLSRTTWLVHLGRQDLSLGLSGLKRPQWQPERRNSYIFLATRGRSRSTFWIGEEGPWAGGWGLTFTELRGPGWVLHIISETYTA